MPNIYCRIYLILTVCFHYFLFISINSTSADEHNVLTNQEISDGWILLFDGQTDYGWRAAVAADWKVADGMISVSKGEVGLLRTTTQFSDYILKLDFRSSKGTNSGVFLRTSPKPQAPGKDCYELNIADVDISPFSTGSLVDQKKVSGNYDTELWQTYEVTVLGSRITVKLDGQEILDFEDPHPLGRGFIGLQHNQGKVDFRNIKLKPLNTKSIFNGKDLKGWKTYPEMASKFLVTSEGYLNVKSGRGQLETTDQFGDFILQIECIANGEHLNSGIFFRCIPGDTMMGYECQIHNGFHEGDRTKPIDCGTGGFFRRKDARKVVADDHQWFSMTLVAEGPHMAAWVNGWPVSDWTDKRKPHENPRRGLRTKAGTIMIQGHDPTTDLSFRNIRLSKISARHPQKISSP